MAISVICITSKTTIYIAARESSYNSLIHNIRYDNKKSNPITTTSRAKTTHPNEKTKISLSLDQENSADTTLQTQIWPHHKIYYLAHPA